MSQKPVSLPPLQIRTNGPTDGPQSQVSSSAADDSRVSVLPAGVNEPGSPMLRRQSSTSEQHEEKKREQTYTLFVRRFILIDTAEDAVQWSQRAKKQWGTSKPIAIRVASESVNVGQTSRKAVSFGSWSGVSWESDSEDIPVPLGKDPVVLLEVVGGTNATDVFGIGILNTSAMIAEQSHYAKYYIHMFSTHATMDAQTVHALVEAEVYSSDLDAPPLKNAYAPLEYNFGSVRVSTLNFYFPSFYLTGTGEYIVSNVLCAMNMTETNSLAMQLVNAGDGDQCISIQPPQLITVRPQQRVYFCATWHANQGPRVKDMRMRLLVNGSHPTSAPIVIQIHLSTPQPAATDTPYHYWINTTCATNRQLSITHEVPLIRSLLPVYRIVSSTNRVVNQNEALIVALDRDSGKTVIIHPNGVPVERSDPIPSLLSNASFYPTAALGALEGIDAMDEGTNHTNRIYRGPVLNIQEKSAECVITLGTIRGFPMVYELSTGVSPSFQVSITLLDQKGWQIVHGETRPSYQSASGSLRWDDQLVLRKWPGASATQFMRLNLTEVSPRDGDETPIGAAIVSLCSLRHTYARVRLCIAFYVYETYSLYDTLLTSSLLMRDSSMQFNDLLSIA